MTSPKPKSPKNNNLAYSLKITLLMAPLLAVPVWLLRFEVPFLGVILGIFLIGVIYALKDRFIYSRLLNRKVTWRETLVLFMVSGVPFFAFLGGMAPRLLSNMFYSFTPFLLVGAISYAFCIDFPYKYLANNGGKGKIFSLLLGKETSVSVRKLLISLPYAILSMPGVIVFFAVMAETDRLYDPASLYPQSIKLLTPFVFLVVHFILNSILKYALFKYGKKHPGANRGMLSRIFSWITILLTILGILLFCFIVFIYATFEFTLL